MPERQGPVLIANGAHHDLAGRDDDAPATGWGQAVRITEAGLEAMVPLPHGPEAPAAEDGMGRGA